MKGLFIPDITAEMFRSGCIESIEALMAKGEIYDIDYEPEQRWIPVSERLPEENMWTICQNNAGAMMIGKYNIEFGWMFPAYFDGTVAWMPCPKPWKEGADE